MGQTGQNLLSDVVGVILFYNKLKGELTEMDFEMNDYDECTFNKMVNGTQLTIQFHVDNLKISYVSQSAIDDVIDDLNVIFGKDKKMSASYEKVHKYLGMVINWSDDNMVKFTMYDYFEDIILETPDEMDGTDVTPAAQHIFHVDEDSPDLDDETAAFSTEWWRDSSMQRKEQDLTYKWQWHSCTKESSVPTKEIGRS